MQDYGLLMRFVFFACLLLTSFDRVTAAQVEAFAGRPFGVARITFSVPAEDQQHPTGQAAMTFDGPDERIHYPTITQGLPRRLLGVRLGLKANLTVMFLFRGDEPFEVTIGTPTEQTFRVVPQRRSRLRHRNMLRRWWRNYNRFFDDLAEETNHPPLIETYLTSMLARRLNLQDPLVDRLTSPRRKHKGYRSLDLLTGAEAMRLRIFEATTLGVMPTSATADLPVPDQVDWRREALPEPDGEVSIEPMAMRVPEECFYIRFGLYSNFLWLNGLLEDYGGELKSMISARGYHSGFNQRLHDQLAVRQSMLAELFGSYAIADVAFIGMDTFMREGPAVGVIFEAQGSMLGSDLKRQREDALARAKDEDASLTTVKVGQRDVSLLSTPDNRLRSYYLTDGKYHLVTNSRRIVTRFLDVADGSGSLGASAEFRHARSVVPISREDTVFIYFSSAFFRNLLGPKYQIELQRRLRAAAEIELLMLARLAAKAEGVNGDSTDNLIAAGMLPSQFGARPDQSHPTDAGDRIVDSRRGRRGSFAPVPDMPVRAVSAHERDRYRQQADYYAEHRQQIDPILVALKRHALKEERRERVTIEAFMTPVEGLKYQLLLSLLGEPSPYKLVSPEENLISIDVAVRGGTVHPDIPPHRLFLGVQNRQPLTTSGPADVLKLWRIVRTAPGFLGAWPKAGFLEMVPFVPESTEGISQIPLGLLRWEGRGFSVLSWDQEILEQASEQLGFVEEDRAAQVRVRVKDLSDAKFCTWLNQLGYERSRRVSVANAKLMSILPQQLDVPLSESRAVVEKLLDSKLVCALGGEYDAVGDGKERGWRSTAWPDSANYAVPEGYMVPLLEWFRGLEVRLIKYPERLVAKGHLDIHRKKGKPFIDLPLIDMFGTPKNAEGSADGKK